MPAGHADIDPTIHVSIIHDDKTAMARRVKRLRSGHAYAQDPASRVHRIVSNVELGATDKAERRDRGQQHDAGRRAARHRQTVHSARCEFSLARHPEGWRIRRKKVNLAPGTTRRSIARRSSI